MNLICNTCKRKETEPFDMGDKCEFCGGIFEIEKSKNLRDEILCPFCGKKPQEYQDAYIDGNGNKIWDKRVQCQTPGCAADGKCFIKEKWLIRA